MEQHRAEVLSVRELKERPGCIPHKSYWSFGIIANFLKSSQGQVQVNPFEIVTKIIRGLVDSFLLLLHLWRDENCILFPFFSLVGKKCFIKETNSLLCLINQADTKLE